MALSETVHTGRTTELAPRRPRGPAYWLIATNENARIEILTCDRDGEKTLPVFSFEEEAEMFLRFAGVGDDWRVRESGAGELVSVLYGPCAGVGKVALDPLPEMMADWAVEFVSLDRGRFIERIMAREAGFSIPADRPSPPGDAPRVIRARSVERTSTSEPVS